MKVYTVSGTHRIDYDFSIEIFKFGCFVDSNKALKRAKAAFIKARDNDFADEIEEYSNEEEYPDIGEGALNIEMDEENGYYLISFGIEEDYESYTISIDEWNVEY